MKQDIKVTEDGLSLAVDKNVSVRGSNALPESAKIVNDPLYKAITFEMELAPYELKDWMRSDVDGDAGKTAIISPELIRAKRAIQAALCEADAEVMRFAVNREWKAAKQNLQTVKGKECGSTEESIMTIQPAKTKFEAIDAEMRRIGTPKYAKTTKALRNYAAAVLAYAEKLSETEKDRTAREAVIDLESRLMPKVDNLYMGVPGRMDPLSRIQLKQSFDPIARLKELEKHLHGRSLYIDQDQENRIQGVANNAIFQNILNRPDDLPKDGAVFFMKAQRMVRVPNGNSPLMIDVSRMSLGLGKEGSGLFRFIGQEHEIDGAAIIKLKLKNGKPIPLKGSDPSNPKYAKEVAELVGNVPEWIKIGMTFGEVMKRFGEASSGNAGHVANVAHAAVSHAAAVVAPS